MTLGERIARLEALVTAGAKNDAEFRAEVREGLKEIRESFKEHKEKTDADEAALAALKNKGIGLLIGVILILGGLQFLPALALGPIVEHFQVLAAVAGA